MSEELNVRIAEIQRRLFRVRLMHAVLPVAALLIVILSTALALSLLHLAVGVAFLAVMSAAVALLSWERGWWRGIAANDASTTLDTFLQSKERVITVRELQGDPARTGARALIEAQLEPLLRRADPLAVVPYVLTKRDRIALGCIGILLPLSLFLAYLLQQHLRPPTSIARAVIEELMLAQPDLPQPVVEKLNQLADALTDDSLSTEEIRDALERAEAEIDKAEKNLELAADEKVLTQEAGAPTPPPGRPGSRATPTPTPEPREPETTEAPKDTDVQNSVSSPQQPGEKKEPQQDRQDRQDRQDQQNQKDQQSQQNQKAQQDQQSKQDQQGKQSKDGGQGKKQQGQQSEQGGKDGKESKQQGGGEGAGKESQQQGQQSQSGGEQGAGKDGDSQGQEGGENKSEQKGEQKPENSQGGSKGGSADKQNNNEGSEQGKQGAPSAAAKAMEAAKDALSKVEQQIERQEQKEQAEGGSGKKPGDAKQPEGAEGQSKGGEKPNDKQDKGSKGDQGKDGQNQNEKSGDKGKQPPKGKDPQPPKRPSGDDSGQNPGDNQNNPKNDKEAPSSAIGKGGKPVERYGEGGEGEGLGEKRGYQEAVVKEGGEKIDTRFAEQGGELRKNAGDATPRTARDDRALAKPEIVRDRGEQPIPLEYRDILQ